VSFLPDDKVVLLRQGQRLRGTVLSSTWTHATGTLYGVQVDLDGTTYWDVPQHSLLHAGPSTPVVAARTDQPNG
jgi:hypothetical protein